MPLNEKFYDKIKCVVCGDFFLRIKRKAIPLQPSRKMSVGVRGKNCITCSKKCSAILENNNRKEKKCQD